MIRTNIYLSTLQHKTVAKEAKKLGVTASEVIRDLIDEGLLQRDYFTKVVMKSDPVLQRLKKVKRAKGL